MKLNLKRVSVIATAISAALVTFVPSAQAAARNGVCESGEFCYYYNSDQTGSVSDFAGSDAYYGEGPECAKFISAGTGRGLCVKNNAASVWNRTDGPVAVFYKSGFSGSVQTFYMGDQANLNSRLFKDNAGHLIGRNDTTHLSQGLYRAAGGRISTYFDGYVTQGGRHEGIDFVRFAGAPVYSLTSGVVTNVDRSGLHTIAIYNRSLGKTVVYLHTEPIGSLAEGQWIERGERIATEANNDGGTAHTHVEMRDGEQRFAAPSVDDPNLTNDNPTMWWVDRGYNICCAP